MFKRPVLGLAVSLATGIFVGYAVELPFLYIYLGCLVFALASLVAWAGEAKVEKGLTFLFVYISAFFLGLILWQGQRVSVSQHPLKEAIKKEQCLLIRGTISAFPEKRKIYFEEEEGVEKEMSKTSFPLKIKEVKRKDAWEDMSAEIMVNIYEPEREFKIGDFLEMEGQLRPLPTLRNPADFDYGNYLLRQGILGQIKIEATGRSTSPKAIVKPVGRRIKTEISNGIEASNGVKLLAWDRINFLMRLAARGREWIEKIIDLGPYDGQGELLKAMIIGKRENLSERVKENFINTGTIHIMAISGLNMVIVMAIILAGCKLIFCPQRWANILCLLTLILYALLTGGRASVWRATIMATLFLGGNFFNRQVDKWTSFSLAALIILFISPPSLFDSGFQLTFMAVGGLIYFYPRLEGIIRMKWKVLFAGTISRYILKSLLAVLVAQLALGPFLIYYYYRFPLTTFIANLMVVPSLGVVTVLGFVSSLAGLVSLSLAQAFNATNSLVLLVIDRVTSFLASWPGQVIYLARPAPLFFVFYYLILFLIFSPLKKDPAIQSAGKK